MKAIQSRLKKQYGLPLGQKKSTSPGTRQTSPCDGSSVCRTWGTQWSGNLLDLVLEYFNSDGGGKTVTRLPYKEKKALHLPATHQIAAVFAGWVITGLTCGCTRIHDPWRCWWRCRCYNHCCRLWLRWNRDSSSA